MSILHLTSENFDEAIGSGRVLVDFWAAWCMPCRMVSPIIDELADEYENRVTVAKVNTDDEEGLAARYEVSTIPTIILFNDGKEEQRIIGVRPKETYKAALDG